MTIVMRPNLCTATRHDVVGVVAASAGFQPRRFRHQFRPFLPGSGPCGTRAMGRCRALQSSEPTNAQNSGEEGASSRSSDRIRSTISGLDELLGVEDQKAASKDQDVMPAIEVSASKQVLEKIGAADAARSKAQDEGAVASQIEDTLARVIEQARKLAESEDFQDKEKKEAGGQDLQRQVEKLLNSLIRSKNGIDKDDYSDIKSKVFGPDTFWVTDVLPSSGLEGGVMFRGNLRGKREKVVAEVMQRLHDAYGGKYVLRVILDVEAAFKADEDKSDRSLDSFVAFEVLPAAAAVPPPPATWQRWVGVLLVALTAASTLSFGLASSLLFLPKETLAFLANPSSISGDALPPGLEGFDPQAFLTAAVSVGALSLIPQVAHDAGHSLVARLRGIQLKAPLLVPSTALGTFGSIRQLASLVRSRTDLFDLAAAGLLGGGGTALALMIAGLQASHGGAVAEPGLIPVPAALFHGSLLLSTLGNLGLTQEALAQPTLYVSPLFVAGWAGIVNTALNALPVGCLDGGRTTLAAFGKGALAFSSLVVYALLGFGALGGPLALPFGLYVLVCQRKSEGWIQDEVSGVSGTRQALALGITLLALTVLLPESAGVLLGGVGAGGPAPDLF
ncbi:EGY1 [Auxenochlorella protothecoides x Auxenochlorella symbiontica]